MPKPRRWHAPRLQARSLDPLLGEPPLRVVYAAEHSGQPAAGARVMKAIQQVTGTKMKSQSAGKMGYGTREVGDLVVAALS